MEEILRLKDNIHFTKWISHNGYLVTSLIVWEQHYEPYQTIIFRFDRDNHINLIYYFQLNETILAFPHDLSNFRTNTEEEKMFFIARQASHFLEKALISEDDSSSENSNQSKNNDLDDILSETFLSVYAIELMREKSPDFGFYSYSPNLNKIEKILNGQSYNLLDFIRKLLLK
jgi:hypothetical protein